jgi:hypothetical protein
MSRREFYGSARENTLWILVVVVGFVFPLLAIRYFPWLDDDATALIRLIAASYTISLLAVFAARRRLFPWASKVPWFQWFAVPVVAVVGALYLIGEFLLLNVVLDRGAPRETRFVVIRRVASDDFRIVPLDRLQAPPSFLWTRHRMPELHVDSVVSVTVRPGAFGHAWAQEYHAVSDDYRSVLRDAHP